MSVIVVGRMNADPATVKQVWIDHAAELRGMQKEAEAAGALHHRWGFGDGFVVIIDEWPDATSFQNFFQNNATIPGLMQAAGVQGQPDFTIVEAVTAPDEF